MCGIAGLMVPESQRAEGAALKPMLDSIIHRGPDDEGTYVRDNIAFGMRRLSIIDLAGGHQPIHNESKTAWVVLNGEIYNYGEIRKSLEAKGHKFYTHSDTETIVHLYDEYGEKFVDHLNGMFGIALWDERKKKLILARDRLGEKQIYYSEKHGKFAFGSEIKCLLKTDVPSRDINLRALDGYLAFLYAPSPATIFADIQELPAAHILVRDASGTRLSRYWSPTFDVEHGVSEGEWIERFRAQLRKSVRSRLVADVPLGALLSGGVDSSAVVAEMAAVGGRVKTFCIGYGSGGAYYDERKYAAMVAKQFGTDHAEFVVTPNVLDVIPKLVDAFDQPFADSSAIANYYVFQETKKHVKVVLSGLGGDEIAAGYERYAGLRMLQQWRALPKWLRGGVIGGLANALPDLKSGNRSIERIKRFVRNGTLDDANAYLGYVSAFDAARRAELWSPAAAKQLAGHDAASYITDRFNDRAASDPINKALYTDTLTYLSGDLLTLTDRMSMLASVEGRAPLIDHELVEFMGRVPPELKLKGTSNKKYLLKKAYEGTLPHEILYRAKRGFTVPLTVWFRNELNPMVRETLSRSRIEKLGLFNWQYVQRIVDEHTSAKENHHSRIWALLMFMQWHERYIGH